MVSGEQFSLRFKNYLNQTLVTFLKQDVPDNGSKWVPEQKLWIVDFRHYDKVLSQIVKLVRGDDYTIEDCYNRPSDGIGLAS